MSQIILEQVFDETINDVLSSNNQENIDNLIECINLSNFDNINEDYINYFLDNCDIYEISLNDFKQKLRNQKKFRRSSDKKLSRLHSADRFLSTSKKNIKNKKDLVDKIKNFSSDHSKILDKNKYTKKAKNYVGKAIKSAVGAYQFVRKNVTKKQYNKLKKQRMNKYKQTSKAYKDLKTSNNSQEKKKARTRIDKHLKDIHKMEKKLSRHYGFEKGKKYE